MFVNTSSRMTWFLFGKFGRQQFHVDRAEMTNPTRRHFQGLTSYQPLPF